MQAAAEAAWLAQHKPMTQVNVTAANRFISHALPDLGPEQRAALKQAKAAVVAAQQPASKAPQKRRQAQAGPAADALLADLLAPAQRQKR